MNAETIAKTSATVILLTIVAALIVCYLTACSSFNAEATLNPLTGAAKVTIQAAK